MRWTLRAVLVAGCARLPEKPELVDQFVTNDAPALYGKPLQVRVKAVGLEQLRRGLVPRFVATLFFGPWMIRELLARPQWRVRCSIRRFTSLTSFTSFFSAFHVTR